MNFLADVVGAGFKGALIRFFRLLFFAIIVIIVIYVVGIFTNKKASALSIKGSQMIQYKNNHDRETQTITAQNTTSTALEFELNSPLTTNYDIVGFNMARFGIHGTTGTGSATSHCDISYLNGQMSDVDCSSSTLDTILADYSGNGIYYHVYGFVRYSDGTQGTCYKSSEYENYIMCPTNDSSITSFVWRMNTALATLFNGIYFHVTMNDEVLLFNYESTDIINGLGNIQTQQQQTNQTLTDSNTTTSQANSTNALSGIQTTMESKLKGTNELTQMVMAPLTILTNVSNASCTPIQWHIPLVNYDATIPCMSTIYSTHFSTILALFSTIITGVFAYRTIVKLVSTIKDSLDAENDKLEVLDL